jgi:hypothetical protein
MCGVTDMCVVGVGTVCAVPVLYSIWDGWDAYSDLQG